MKKYSEMNYHEKLTVMAVKEAYSDLVGGDFNTLEDYPEDSEEYQNALAFLMDEKEVKHEIRFEAKRNITEMFGKNARFASNAFMDEVIDRILKRDEELQELWRR